MPALVLVVEDEVVLGEAIGTYLERHGYGTAIARSGRIRSRCIKWPSHRTCSPRSCPG